MKNLKPFFLAFVSFGLATGALAHVSLQDPRAEAGRPYQAVLVLGHGCDGATTTGVSVQVPAGFSGAKPQPRPGWALALRGDTATWTASDPASGLPSNQRGEFTIAGVAPQAPGALWFKVLQTCGKASLDWSQVPADGTTSTAGMKAPAALLRVLSPAEFALSQSLPKVEGAWVRSTVPGQKGTGAFMKLAAVKSVQLVGVASPVAGSAEVHEMKMEGDVMRMRPVAQLELAAGRTTEFKPSGYHIMLLDLKQPLADGSTVPLTLFLRDAAGTQARLELRLPVTARAPGAAGSAGAAEPHKH